MKNFIGRYRELERLEDLLRSERPCMVVIKGRRRIGKSRLAEEFGKGKIFLPFSGLAPNANTTAQTQRDDFARKLSNLFDIPPFTFTDWSDGFLHLTKHLSNKPTVILFDEISWMGSKDPTFIAKLKDWWDCNLQKYSSLVLILCGSVSTWIEQNIINSTALFGRISLYLDLTELSIPDSKKFLEVRGFKGSDQEIFKILCVTGGVPWYLEQIQSNKTADENIKELCFTKEGILVHEFDRIFSDLFSSKGEIYKKIVISLSKGMKNLAELRNDLKYPQSGTFSQYLKDLETCGFIGKHPNWSFKTGKHGKSTLYRVSDNYLRFYIHYIEPNIVKIDKGSFLKVPLSSLPGIDIIFGFQLENLILNNRSLIYDALGIYVQDVVHDDPYIQKKSGKKKGCQIDYLIQSRTNTFFVCEIKMRHSYLDSDVIAGMKQKITSFAPPKGFGIAPVLIHLGHLSEAILASTYFYRVIDIAKL